MKVSTVRLNNQFELDLSSYKLRKARRVIHLEKMPMELLILLAEKPGQLVTREEIIERLWGSNIFVDTRQGINTAIRKIRLATNDDPEKPRVVETVVGKGYRLIVAEHEPPAVGNRDSIPAPTLGVRSRFAWVLFAAGAVICIAIVGLWWRRSPSQALGAQSEWSQMTNFPDSAACPALSPDGRMLAFVRGGCSSTGEIYVEMLPGGKPVQLTHNGQLKGALAFSPDGSRVSYSVLPAWDTWVVPVVGGEPERMLANASGLQWLDGEHVLFSELDRGVHMGIVTATLKRAGERGVYLPAKEVGMAHASRLSPDGKSVLVVEMDAQGWTPCRLVPFDGSSLGKLVGPPGAACLDAGWSPDGKWMFLDVDTGRGFHIWRQGSAKGKAEQITNGPTQQLGIAVPRDGRSLLTSVSVSSYTVWIHDRNGTRKIPFAGSAGFPVPQVSSRAVFRENNLYFLGQEGPEDSWDLWAMDLRSQHATRVVSGMRIESFDISRDGKQIAFAAIGSAGLKNHDGTLPNHTTLLWIDDVDKASAPHLLDPAVGRRPLFSANDDLVFEADESSSTYAYVRNLRSGGLRKITTNPIVRLETVSPDGRWVVAEVPVIGEDVTRGVVGLDLQGGIARRICHGLCVARWTLDGKSLFLSLPGGEKDSESWFGAKTFVIPLHPGESFPDLPPTGVQSDGEVLRIPGATVINEFVRPGTDASIYAIDRTEVHANIYRIPLQN